MKEKSGSVEGMISRKARPRPALAALAALVALLPAAATATELQEQRQLIWTDKPMRIDRGKQTYERIVIEHAEPPLVLRPTNRVRTFDGVSFQEGGPLYVLTDAVAVDPRQICRGQGDRLAACGQQARLFLKRLIAGRKLGCKEDFRDGTVRFVTCTLDKTDLAETLVSRGAAWAATPRLAAAQEEAMQQQAGIWFDTECARLGRCVYRRHR